MADNQGEHDKPSKGNENKKGDEDKKANDNPKPKVKMSKNQKLLMHMVAINWPEGFDAENWAGIAERRNMSESAAEEQWNVTQQQFVDATQGVAVRSPVVRSRQGKKRDAEAAASGNAPGNASTSATPKRRRVTTKAGTSKRQSKARDDGEGSQAGSGASNSQPVSPTPASAGFVPALSEEEEREERVQRIRANPFSHEGMEDWLSEAHRRQGLEWNDTTRRAYGLPPLNKNQ
ncbi:hypothetical protein PG991_010808 [Apiospora marii]|uniref:Myb-like domain-containing protein n=1 Tax=Apiospora marii TaxID=335849 RepID=A0ABR1RCD2_9PEZI